MKKLCFLLAAAFLLSGCCVIPMQVPKTPNEIVYDQPVQEYTGEVNVIQGGSMIIGGIEGEAPVIEIPIDQEDEDVIYATVAPEESERSEVDPRLVGEWEYVGTIDHRITITISPTGGAEVVHYNESNTGPMSIASYLPEIENGRITFPPDAEYDPPVLVLQLEYVEDVGYILDVVSTYGSYHQLTEYFSKPYNP